MSGIVFWDVDTQVDFMVPDGKLYVPDAAAITPNLERLTRRAREHGIPRVASVDDHTLLDPEISDTPDFRETFPAHCLRGTEGQKKIPATAMRSPVVVPDRALEPEKEEMEIDEEGELVEKSPRAERKGRKGEGEAPSGGEAASTSVDADSAQEDASATKAPKAQKASRKDKPAAPAKP